MAVRLLCLALTSAAVPGQAPRLVDAVESPMAYLSLECGAAPVGASAESGPRAPTAASGPVQRLLADPNLDALFGSLRGSPAGPGEVGGELREAGPVRALALVRGVVARSSGELELALTGVVPTAGQPLLVLRARLQRNEVDRLQTLLDGDTLAAAHRALGGHRTYRLRGDGQAGGSEAPGELVELALVGDDLIVGNDGLAMQELLAPPAAMTTATPARRVLSADRTFLAMRQQMAAPAGSLLLYGDWRRLGQRLRTRLAGLPGVLLEWSGLGSAQSVMISLSPAQSDFAATLLLDFGPQGVGGAAGGGTEPSGIDGWLAAVQSVPLRSLLPELPNGGLGGIVVAADLADLASRSERGAHLLQDLRHSLQDYGLDFDRNVLGRLGSRGTVQLLLRRGGSDAATEVVSVYAVRAKSRKAAADLFVDLRRAAEAHGMGRVLPSRDRKAPEILELRPIRDAAGEDGPPTCVALFEDSVLVAFDAETILQVHEEYRRSARTRARRDSVVSQAIQRIDGADVAGLFDLDLQPLFEGLAPTLSRPGASFDLSSVPRRHIGYVDLERHEAGTLVRIRVLSSR